MKRSLIPVFILLFIGTFQLSAQKDLLQSGPMLGYSEMREVLLWVQTNTSATVQFAYWPKDDPSNRQLTDSKVTEKKDAYVAQIIATEVEPSMTYEYQLLINGKKIKLDYPTEFQTQTLWQWRQDPPAFSFIVGSCTYVNEPKYDRPGDAYGGAYKIFESIYEQDPDMMIWMGDNIYLREVDWFTTTGIQKRYTSMRSLPEMQALLANTHHYAIWDDHDFGPNNSDRSFIHKDKTLDAFKLFWGNPSYGLGENAGITSQFQWNDADFFLLDNRYFRSPNRRKSGDATILGKEQLEWLIDALVFSKANFKFVAIGGMVLSDAPVFENYAANRHGEERAYLLKRIEEEGIKNVIFLSGDRHHTELSRLETDSGIVMYDLTVSPLTSGASTNVDEVNGNRVDGTAVFERNFGKLEVSGPFGQRVLTITVFNTQGEQLWQQEIKQTPRK